MAHRQPALHALDLCVLAPTAVLSDHSGQIDGPGHGVLHADVRVLSRASLSLDGTTLTAIRTVPDGTGRSRFVLLARDLGDAGPDPTVRVERHRQATVNGVVERIVLTSTAREPVHTTIRLALAADLIDMALVKSGLDGAPVPMRIAPGGLTWGRDGIIVTVTAPDADISRGELSWPVELKPRTSIEVGWQLRVTDLAAIVIGVSTQALNVSTPAASVSTAAAGVSAPAVGVSTPVAGVSTHAADVSAPVVGVSSGAVGVSAPVVGESAGAVGVSSTADGALTKFARLSSGAVGVSSPVDGVDGVSTPDVGVSTRAVGVSTPGVGVSAGAAGVSARDVGVSTQIEWARPTVTADDRRLVGLVERSLDDLAALRLATVDQPGETFLAAGAPWFFTLFGRDSLWAARLMLPLGTELAGSTLRALAARQGTVRDVATAESPGKILHELRRNSLQLPSVYYGSIDATLLWVCLLHDAWRWGLPDAQIEPLLLHLELALTWLADDADPDGDGFLEYRDTTGRGLANQGWKDSGDSIRFADGRVAAPPIALCEVQGYAHEAAVKGAALLTAFDRPGADRWLAYADRLATRFRARFWVTDSVGPYPAIALDGDKRPVDALTSNIGHLMGSGMLNDAEIAAIAARLVAPDMSSGFGLRTMSASAGGFSPLSYHCGAVWPHDTVIVAQGLASAGHGAAATSLVHGLLRAAPAFGYRLPELYGGDASSDLPQPAAYPAACRPQAWAAAAGIGILTVLTGVRPDVPRGAVHIAPPTPNAVGALTVRGLRVGGSVLGLDIGADGRAVVVQAPGGLAVTDRPPLW